MAIYKKSIAYIKRIISVLCFLLAISSLHGQSSIKVPEPYHDLQFYDYKDELVIDENSTFESSQEEWIILQSLLAKTTDDLLQFMIFQKDEPVPLEYYNPMIFPLGRMDNPPVDIINFLKIIPQHKIKFTKNQQTYVNLLVEVFSKGEFVAFRQMYLIKDNNTWKRITTPIDKSLSFLVRHLKTKYLKQLVIDKKGDKLINELVAYAQNPATGLINLDRVVNLILDFKPSYQYIGDYQKYKKLLNKRNRIL